MGHLVLQLIEERMKDWQIIPEIAGCNATLRMATLQAADAVEQGRHFVVEGEAGSGRRLLARTAWYRSTPRARALFTLDCRIFGDDSVEALLFGERSADSAHATLHLGKLGLAMGGGLLLLHAEFLPLKTQLRLAQTLENHLFRPRGEGVQLLLTSAPALDLSRALHPELAGMLMPVRVPALRERVEDIRAIVEVLLHNAFPFDRICCSQALIDRFCGYDWPGNINELRSVLRRLLLQPHGGLLDVRHLDDLICRDESCFGFLQGSPHPIPSLGGSSFFMNSPSTRGRSLQ
jgi:two-component system nitrogen regulation response regulator NtrX